MDETAMDTNLGFACAALRAVDRARPGAGDRVAVVGRGPLGDLVMAALADVGVADVRHVDAGIFEQPLDVAFETTGDPAVVGALLDGAPRATRIVLLGASQGRTADVDFYRTVHQRGLVLMGVATPADPDAAVDVDAARRLVTRAGGKSARESA